AQTTNAAQTEPRQLREDLIKNRMQDDMFRQWGAEKNSLGGALLPPASQPNLSPAQMRQLKEKLDEQRYWMFANPDDAGKASAADDIWKTRKAAPGLLDGLDADTPRVLQKYFEEDSGLDSAGNRWLGKSARSKSAGGRGTFEPGETAASRAISRLFQPNGGRTLAVVPVPGLFSEVFSPPASIPLERSPETIQRMSEFQKLLDSPAATAAKTLGALPTVTPGASGFGGMNNPMPGTSLPGAAAPAGNPSLLGASSPPTVATPAPTTISQFQPVTPPKRRF
ncbi:MAG: hypothetical protein NTZ16_07655, partial [Verrucomicrobia bacterium]|nr:hypothetical protein [Verrucomicrobiota bacterium]